MFEKIVELTRWNTLSASQRGDVLLGLVGVSQPQQLHRLMLHLKLTIL
ncbi:hypothetical protein FOXG_22623 [Fusarium oxysporum f. sp. lycopersici 4287]|uniref:Uncharacterized protein n=1 Tax=Fusarium oxysporum f. sp. lycopersici (strain 4287 / CBS 123668 / FGSC 9935 / NRRL 34936) TaxID=426428 RepID=A0A0J9W9W2_FUSO4|nr:hypothetical protein FOXG_22623 [Fusarium oxysporum f. sp. lycopersici 4287]KNB19648.1 hypothetical protein FOXG_22623 [Fusarium oxysporum f. sp. lycopersici 4287]